MAQLILDILIIALLTLPAAISNQYFKRLVPMMILTGMLTMLLTTVGTSLSYLSDLPSGSVIILLSGALYLLSVILGYIRRRKHQSIEE